MPFDYPRAGSSGDREAARDIEEVLAFLHASGVDDVGPTVVQAVARLYRRLPVISPETDKSQTPFLYYLLGSGTSPLKMSQEDAAYQVTPGPVRQKCSTCSSSYKQVVTGNLICSQVEGLVDLNGWCRIWNHDRS